MKSLLLILIMTSSVVSAQLLTVNNLQNISASTPEQMDAKLGGHFDLMRMKEHDEKDIRVYTNNQHQSPEFMVVTVFLKDKNCHVLSVVSHHKKQIETLREELIKNGFTSEKIIKDESFFATVYQQQQISVIIKEPDVETPAHQIVWMCKQIHQ